MGNLDLWLAPLILLPGIGLLILSTAARFGQLQSQLIQLNRRPSPESNRLGHSLYKRGRCFRKALSGFYLSGVAFTLSSTINGLNTILPFEVPLGGIIAVSFVGFAALLIGSGYLVRESFTSVDVVDAFHARIMARHANNNSSQPVNEIHGLIDKTC